MGETRHSDGMQLITKRILRLVYIGVLEIQDIHHFTSRNIGYYPFLFVCLFDLILYVPSTVFQL